MNLRQVAEYLGSLTLPFCTVCERPVEWVERYDDHTSLLIEFVYHCHWKTEKSSVTNEALETDIMGTVRSRWLIAFASERGEIDRLANEDAALAACGIIDSEAARLDAEDAALSACGRTS